ncbi:YolD-like family protein [Ornithinibacillus sp. L9]|uniref:YolD-like family protein n=1 Tax=Ornithinibacillus caprae TaxID=2678566 RepID=A0A6N8FN25_9BACI|nr:YolD-like family protein [Ornithinibacillus caprae]MUK89169.1 YolD-like family protein [Ornithinibacillus caprae]
MHDRGSIKWTSMMMPEHIQMLRDLDKQYHYKQKPVLDDQELQEINNKLLLAIHNNLTVAVKYYKDHDYHYVTGKLKKIDAIEKYILFEDFTKINLHDVLDVQID